MDLITPDFGLFFWTLILFAILLFLLKKFAWKPILEILGKREHKIQESLDYAEKAKEEMEKLKIENQQIMQKAKAERDLLLKEAKVVRTRIIQEAEIKARERSEQLIKDAYREIEEQKYKAISEINEKVIDLSIEVAEKVLLKEFESTKTQADYAKLVLEQLN